MTGTCDLTGMSSSSHCRFVSQVSQDQQDQKQQAEIHLDRDSRSLMNSLLQLRRSLQVITSLLEQGGEGTVLMYFFFCSKPVVLSQSISRQDYGNQIFPEVSTSTWKRSHFLPPSYEQSKNVERIDEVTPIIIDSGEFSSQQQWLEKDQIRCSNTNYSLFNDVLQTMNVSPNHLPSNDKIRGS